MLWLDIIQFGRITSDIVRLYKPNTKHWTCDIPSLFYGGPSISLVLRIIIINLSCPEKKINVFLRLKD